MREESRVRHVMVGYDQRILSEYFRVRGDFVNYNHTQVFKIVKEKKEGVVMLVQQNVEYLLTKEKSGAFSLVMFDEGFDKFAALELNRGILAELQKSYSPEKLRETPEFGLDEFRPKIEALLVEVEGMSAGKLKHVKEETMKTENILVENL